MAECLYFYLEMYLGIGLLWLQLLLNKTRTKFWRTSLPPEGCLEHQERNAKMFETTIYEAFRTHELFEAFKKS